MIVLGIILLAAGYLIPLSVLITIGWILVVIGAILWILGSAGGGRYAVGGRRYWF